MKTCKKLEKIGNTAFDDIINDINLTDEKEDIKREEMVKLFTTFGHRIENIKINIQAFNGNYRYPLADTMRLIQIHSNTHIRGISIQRFDWHETTIMNTLMFTPNLTKLILRECTFDCDILEILARLPLIEELVLNDCGDTLPLLPRRNNNFQRIHLKKLIIRNLRHHPTDIFPFIEIINSITPNLEELEVNEIVDYPMLSNISKLKNLKKLTINFFYDNPIPFLQEIIQEEIFLTELTMIRPDQQTQFINLLSQMRTLKKLTLSGISKINTAEIVNVINNSIIEELTLHNVNLSYRNILFKLCENINTLKKLNLYFLGHARITKENVLFLDHKLGEKNQKIYLKIKECPTKLGERIRIETKNLQVQVIDECIQDLRDIMYPIY